MKKLILVFLLVIVPVVSFGQIIHDRSYYSVKDTITYRGSIISEDYHTLKIMYSVDRKNAYATNAITDVIIIRECNVYKTDNIIFFVTLDVTTGEETNIIYIYNLKHKTLRCCW